jgi:pimeloyl-ACP methyl ester carboxylesterase
MSTHSPRDTAFADVSSAPPLSAAAAATAERQQVSQKPKPRRRSDRPGHIGLVVLGSIALGLVAALAMALLVVGGSREATITGVLLLGFAAGWALLAVWSVRRTDQPQRWAVVPAAFMGLSGVGFLVLQPGIATIRVIGWVWPIGLLALVVWMAVQSRRYLRNWSRRVVLYPVFAVLAAMTVSAAYQEVEQARDQTALSMSGQLVDVGDHRLHIDCSGTGSPTVILEGGLGELSTTMAAWIAPAVAQTTRLCVYDRSGYGWSDPAPQPQDGRAVAADLHALLAAAHVPPPYVLAGHSTGGVYAQIFAAKYPREVAGMVLLDAQSPDVYAQLPGWRSFYAMYTRAEALLPSLSRLGITRIGSALSSSDLPPAAGAEVRAFTSTADYYHALHDELAQLRTSLTEAQQLTTLGDKPLFVVTAGKDAQAGWLPLQDKMALLSTDSVHRVFAATSHTSLIENRRDSLHAVSAIIDVVQGIRSGARLNPRSPSTAGQRSTSLSPSASITKATRPAALRVS